MAKSDIQAQIDFILKELRKNVPTTKILSGFVQNWPTKSEKTFQRRKNEAMVLFQGEMKRIQQKAEVLVRKEIEDKKIEIMDSVERKEILTQIARGEIKLKKLIVVDKGIEEREVVPDWMDRKNAINELNKMDGEHAPTKVAPTDKDGNDLPQQPSFVTIDVSILPTEILEQIIQIHKPE